jgi:hypothetical protein
VETLLREWQGRRSPGDWLVSSLSDRMGLFEDEDEHEDEDEDD